MICSASALCAERADIVLGTSKIERAVRKRALVEVTKPCAELPE